MTTSTNRRDFLSSASAASLGALAAGYPTTTAAAKAKADSLDATADTVIVLWLAGGMASTDTFDPKRYTPYEKGLDPNRVLSTFPSIDTAVDGLKFTEGLEKIGAVMDRGTLIKTYRAADLGFILHSRHQFHWHTAYEPPLTVAAPHIGSWISRTLGPLNPDLPAFIDIGQTFDGGEKEALQAFHTSGFLGSEFAPFFLVEPDQAVEAVKPPVGMSDTRFANRYEKYKKLLADSPIQRHGSEHQRDSLLRSVDNAHRLLSSPKARKAFDLSLEPKESYEKYKVGGRFGLGCLLARRLTEAGARFIEVTHGYYPFKYWDTHDNGHTRMKDLKAMIDAPIAQLVLDLEARKLLDRTLIVVASEFSRDMMMEGKPEKKVKDQVNVPPRIDAPQHYGMHRHFTGAGSVLLFGGGVKKGFVYGETA
ncbi:MAG: hypothetical protein ACI9UA_005929, partial [Pseudoalteromonas tetraodonis]